MEEHIRIVLVEDVKTDAELIAMELENAGMSFNLQRVETKDAFIQALQEYNPDIILSDFSLPIFSALEALKIKQELKPYTPLILVTGAQSEEIAVECIKKGADDYLLKSSLTRLPTSIRNSLKKKRAELENKLSLEKYRHLFENSLVGMFRASVTDGIFLEANDKAKQILGIEAVEGLKFEDLRLFENPEDFCQQFLDGKKSFENFETEIIKSDSTKAWISISAKLYEEEDIIEGVIQDITHTKNSFLELESANYELDRFVYHASHDMRAPLKSMAGLIQVILEEDALDEIKACTLMMQRSTEKLSNLIDDLLVLARNKKAEARITSIDFNLEVKDCLNQLSFLADIHKIRIDTQIQQEHPFFSDGVRLRIILNNLISNAIKYHRLQQADAYIFIKIEVSPTMAYLSVEDNGSGIDDKHVDRIFDMFYRATNASEGTGLGLYLVKQTIDKLGGKITLKSKPQVGTTFSIEIPNGTHRLNHPKQENSAHGFNHGYVE